MEVVDNLLLERCLPTVASLFKQPKQPSLYTCGFSTAEAIDPEFSAMQIFHLEDESSRLIRWIEHPEGMFELYTRNDKRFVFFQENGTEVSGYFMLSSDYESL